MESHHASPCPGDSTSCGELAAVMDYITHPKWPPNQSTNTSWLKYEDNETHPDHAVISLANTYTT